MFQTTDLQRKGPEPIQGIERSEDLLNDQEWARDLLDVVRHFDIADKFTRDRLVRKWRKQMCYWDSLQYLWWSDVVHDWRTPDQAVDDLSGSGTDIDVDPNLYAKVVNIYRAHGEVIIAAMSASTPKVVFPPDDADSPDDILAAKAKSKLSELIMRHNYAEMLLIKALFILYNQGLVCAYNETYWSEEYGTVKQPIESDVVKSSREYMCPDCGQTLGTEDLGSRPASEDGGQDDGTNPDPAAAQDPDADQDEGTEQQVPALPVGLPGSGQGIPPVGSVRPANNIPPIGDTICQNCSNQAGTEIRVQPEFEDYDELSSEVTGWDVENKCRELLTFWGPLNVKLPAWIRRIQDTPYLTLETEEHYAKMQDVYPELADKIVPGTNLERFDRAMRTPVSYAGDTPRDLCTVRRTWLRPWAFNVLGTPKQDLSDLASEKIADLKERFPKGVYVVTINDDVVAEAVPDKLDDHWTVTHHPLSDEIHAEPIGAPMMPVQEITNELVNLELESIEHNIAEVFADTDTLDFNAYEKSEARPGQVFPVQKRPGEPIGNSFYSISSGTLGKEVEVFAARLEKFAQFVVGSLPSVFGGQIEGGSNTAKEYEMSRTQALQRLSTTWKLVTMWWGQVIGKATNSYAKELLEDEHFSIDKGGGNFMNVWIRRAHLEGKVGNAYAEASESIPISWNEKRSIIMNMLTMQNPQVMQVLADPENASFVARIIGVPELYIPGDEDRTKQLMEIMEMIQSEPMEMPGQGIDPTTGQPPIQEQSSVAVDPDLDNHVIEAEVCAVWLKSLVGQDMKKTQPASYYNVLLHFKEHNALAKQAQMAQTMAGQQPPPSGSGGDGNNDSVGEMNANA